ncbi:hypothetical protein ABIB50_005063 [Mucilaginibacter sp. UYCu711]
MFTISFIQKHKLHLKNLQLAVLIAKISTSSLYVQTYKHITNKQNNFYKFVRIVRLVL